MSFDLAVWYPHEQLTAQAALRVYQDLCEGKPTELIPHPVLDAFYEQLTGSHPEIDDVPEDRIEDHEFCPWSVAHDRSDRHIIMCCVWSRAEYVHDFVHQLARKHGLAVFDPRSSTITYPDGSQGPTKSWWKFW